ncbi:hypothetical protein LCGC14_2817270, partial [marine sediment metagenome]
TLTVTAQVEAPAVADNIEINEASGDTAGAVLRMGLSGFPLRKDTAGTNFIYGNFTGSGGGSTKGLTILMVPTGTPSYTKAILGDIRPTAVVGNLAALQGECVLGAASGITGLGYAIGAYFSFPAAVVASAGNYAGLNVEVAFPASCDIGTPGAGGAPVRTSVIRCAISGDTTAKGTFEDTGTMFSFVGFTQEQYGVVSSQRLAELPAGSIGLRIGVGTAGGGDAFYFIPAVPLAEWN